MPLATYFSSNVQNTTLVIGTLGFEKEVFARKMAKDLLGIEKDCHPDLFEYFPEGKLGIHSMESMRSFRDEVYKVPYQAQKKVFLIHDAERMAIAAANAVLKTLEEPLISSFIILISAYPEKLLPTIRSRCQTIAYFEKVPLNAAKELIFILANLYQMACADVLKEVQVLVQALENVEPAKDLSNTEMSAWQKEVEEKKGEGKLAIALSIRLDLFFRDLIAWFRDIHLLHLQGNLAHLVHQDQKNHLQQWVEKGALIDLDRIEDMVRDAKKSIERSSSLRSTLETLFLRIHKSIHIS